MIVLSKLKKSINCCRYPDVQDVSVSSSQYEKSSSDAVGDATPLDTLNPVLEKLPESDTFVDSSTDEYKLPQRTDGEDAEFSFLSTVFGPLFCMFNEVPEQYMPNTDDVQERSKEVQERSREVIANTWTSSVGLTDKAVSNTVGITEVAVTGTVDITEVAVSNTIGIAETAVKSTVGRTEIAVTQTSALNSTMEFTGAAVKRGVVFTGAVVTNTVGIAGVVVASDLRSYNNTQKSSAQLLTCKPIDFSNPEVYGPQFKAEMKRLFLLYSGYTHCEDIKYELKSSINGVKVYVSFFGGSQWPVLRSISQIKADKQSILDLMTTDSRTVEYDETCVEVEPVLMIDESTPVRIFRYSGVWPVAGREFVVCSYVDQLPDGHTLLVSMSPPDCLSPIKINSSYVRGNIKLAGMILRELEDGVCELDMFAHCDLNGSFPIGPLSVFAVNNTTKQHQRFKDILTKK